MSQAWDDVRRRLEHELLDLVEHEFVIVGEPAAPSPARGLLRRRSRAASSRYAQVRRDGENLYAECIGATSFGGDWEVAPAEQARMRELGWLVPGEEDPSGVQPSYPNYWKVLPRREASQLARMCTDALAVLGTDPLSVDWQRDA